MGRIKSAMIKRATKQLLEGESIFTDEFNNNKKILGRTMPSKPIRNKIAGYMARLKKAEKKVKQPKPKAPEVEEEPQYKKY